MSKRKLIVAVLSWLRSPALLCAGAALVYVTVADGSPEGVGRSAAADDDMPVASYMCDLGVHVERKRCPWGTKRGGRHD